MILRGVCVDANSLPGPAVGVLSFGGYEAIFFEDIADRCSASGELPVRPLSFIKGLVSSTAPRKRSRHSRASCRGLETGSRIPGDRELLALPFRKFCIGWLCTSISKTNT